MVSKAHGNPIHKNILSKELDPFYFEGNETRKVSVNTEKENKVLQMRLNLIKSINEASQLYDCLDKEDLLQYSQIKRETEEILSRRNRLSWLFTVVPFAVLGLYRFKTNGIPLTQTFIKEAHVYPAISLGLIGMYSMITQSKLGSLNRESKDIESIYYTLSLMNSIAMSNYKHIRFNNLDKVYF